MLIILTSIFLLFYAALIGYYCYYWRRLDSYVLPAEVVPVPVSVVVAARNEEQCIGQLLDALLKQTYPRELYEIIIVDDFSTDRTAEIIRSYAGRGVKLVHPNASSALQSSKKKAIEAGVRAATGELIVITDADCLPSPNWLRSMAGFYRSGQSVFIAAPVAFRVNGSLLHIFQSLDFMMLQGITAASVASGAHSMCNGANLAYTREAFLDVNGFEGIDKVASGDDMLLMYKIWKRQPAKVKYIKSRDAIMHTGPMPSWKKFFQQRIRWSSKAAYYDDYRITAVLFFVYLLNLLFLVLIGAVIYDASNWWVLLLYLSGKTIIEGVFLLPVSRFYQQQKLVIFFPLLQPLHILYTVVIGLVSQFGTYEWKGRRTK